MNELAIGVREKVDKLKSCAAKLLCPGETKFRDLHNDIEGLKQKLSVISSSHIKADWEEFKHIEIKLNDLL